MSCSDFIGNLEGLNGGTDFPKELLKVNSVTLPDHQGAGAKVRALGRISWMVTWEAMNVSVLIQEIWWFVGLQLSSCLAGGNMGLSCTPRRMDARALAAVLVPSLLLLCLHCQQGGTCGAVD